LARHKLVAVSAVVEGATMVAAELVPALEQVQTHQVEAQAINVHLRHRLRMAASPVVLHLMVDGVDIANTLAHHRHHKRTSLFLTKRLSEPSKNARKPRRRRRGGKKRRSSNGKRTKNASGRRTKSANGRRKRKNASKPKKLRRSRKRKKQPSVSGLRRQRRRRSSSKRRSIRGNKKKNTRGCLRRKCKGS
jgi:hypothetical protein